MTASSCPASSSRALSCERCGAGFTCGGDIGCWCAAEPYRLPMPAPGATSDCLCPDCLRAAAAKAPAETRGKPPGTTPGKTPGTAAG
ncbi:MAG: cysteine-rich CWC family protein [Pseudolabrys sp.]